MMILFIAHHMHHMFFHFELNIKIFLLGLGIDEGNPVSLAWRLLEVILMSCEEDMQTVLHKVVSSRLLALGVFLPNWLFTSYKVTIYFISSLSAKFLYILGKIGVVIIIIIIIHRKVLLYWFMYGFKRFALRMNFLSKLNLWM